MRYHPGSARLAVLSLLCGLLSVVSFVGVLYLANFTEVVPNRFAYAAASTGLVFALVAIVAGAISFPRLARPPFASPYAKVAFFGLLLAGINGAMILIFLFLASGFASG